MASVEKALLFHYAMHNPDGITQFEQQLFAEAASDDHDQELVDRARGMLENIRSGAVLDDAPAPDRGSRAEHGEDRG